MPYGRVVARIIEPGQGRPVAGDKVTNQFRRDCQAGCPVCENDDRAAFPQRADGEGGKRAIVAPMKEGALIGLKAPAEAPRDSRRPRLCIRNEALYAGMFHWDMGSKPSLRAPRR